MMTSVLSTLKLIEIEKICLHEAHECVRLLETSQAIEADGMLRNPPLAVLMRDGRYLIIDGAHRTGSLHCIGCHRVPVQVVEEGEFMLEAWYHAVPVGEWLTMLQADPFLRFTERRDGEPIAEMDREDGTTLFIYPAERAHDPIVRLEAWHRVVTSYSSAYSVTRVAPHMPHLIQADTVLMRYPACNLYELEEVVLSGNVMPAGVTRFTVPGRLLNLRIPLDLLKGDAYDQEDWERLCAQWAGSLRLYSEAVYFCEV